LLGECYVSSERRRDFCISFSTPRTGHSLPPQLGYLSVATLVRLLTSLGIRRIPVAAKFIESDSRADTDVFLNAVADGLRKQLIEKSPKKTSPKKMLPASLYQHHDGCDHDDSRPSTPTPDPGDPSHLSQWTSRFSAATNSVAIVPGLIPPAADEDQPACNCQIPSPSSPQPQMDSTAAHFDSPDPAVSLGFDGETAMHFRGSHRRSSTLLRQPSLSTLLLRLARIYPCQTPGHGYLFPVRTRVRHASS